MSATPPASRPTSSGETHTFRTVGSTVIARCDGTTVRLLNAAPALGYGLEDYDPGPDAEAKVRFEGDAGRVELRVVCVDGRPEQRAHD